MPGDGRGLGLARHAEQVWWRIGRGDAQTATEAATSAVVFEARRGWRWERSIAIAEVGFPQDVAERWFRVRVTAATNARAVTRRNG